MTNEMKEFEFAKNRFEEATTAVADIEYPITYDVWMTIPDNYKAAALYVQFYEQITLAWTKARSEFTEDGDGVSTCMQYLIKNVPIIMVDSKKFSPAYIYKIAYNCMGCLRRVIREQERYANTVSQYAYVGDNELDFFESILCEDVFINTNKKKAAVEIGKIIITMDSDLQKMVDHLLNGTKLSKKVAAHEEELMDTLRKTFGKYRETYVPTIKIETFADVLKYEDFIDSAVVEMRDGAKAVYCGEKHISTITDKSEVVFFGPDKDYIMPINTAKALKVISIEEVE